MSRLRHIDELQTLLNTKSLIRDKVEFLTALSKNGVSIVAETLVGILALLFG
jgi:hypothetical protein